MSAIISEFVGSLRLGDPVSDSGLTLTPIFGDFPTAPEFVTLEQAMSSNALKITEVSEGGAVPLLKAHNRGPLGVLILDGEELAGAKQNRVLNTTVYIRPGQEVVIPVSCTEAGRWNYRSRSFADSGYVAAQAIRLAANESVTDSLRSGREYRSDQGRVWNEVSLLQSRHRHVSPTSAARDVYEQKREELRHRGAVFTCLPGQCGLLALWSGRVAGLDVIAGASPYAGLHARLVDSYALDAPAGRSSSPAPDSQVAREWLSRLSRLETSEHESPGAGISYRFVGRGVVGAGLAVDGTVLHAVALATPEAEPPREESRYPGFFERRAQFPW